MYAIRPNDNAKLEEYKAIIKQKFYPKRGYGKMRLSVCRKAVKDFKALDPSAYLLADLMLCIPEYAAEIANDGVICRKHSMIQRATILRQQ